MEAPRFRESPFEDCRDRYSDGALTEVDHAPEIRPACELSSAQGFQWIHDVILDLVERLSWWEGVGYYFDVVDRNGDEPEELEGYSAVQALETAQCIEQRGFATSFWRCRPMA